MFGVTTMGVTEESILSMVNHIYDSGFRSVEIIAPIALAAHAYPPGLRRDLEKSLRRFACVTVHAQTAQVDCK